jgi:hypothetical protein
LNYNEKYLFEKNIRIGNPEVQSKKRTRKKEFRKKIFHADIPTPFQVLVVFKVLVKFLTGRD